MKFSSSAAWAETTAMARRNPGLIATVAGVFIFLPYMILAYLLPPPDTSDPSRVLEVIGTYFTSNLHWFLLQGVVAMVGTIAILLLVFSRDISVGGAIGATIPILPFYFLASLVGGLIVGLGFLLLIVPGLYLWGRLAPLGPVVVAENRRNPIDAVTRTFALTRNKGWAIFFYILLVAVAAAILFAVVGALVGMILVLILGQNLGGLLATIVGAAFDAALAVLLTLVGAGIYRQLGGDRATEAASTFE